jgi:MoaA/NifB/PqqE/SkfB family radical SAM enzyme
MSFPLKRCHIELSTLCNSKCITCPQSKINRDKRINLHRVQQLITKDLVDFKDSLELVEFHNYNEPLLTFETFVEMAKLVNATFGEGKVGLVTNGSIMNELIADELIALKLSHIFFSIDGFTKGTYESHRVGLNRNTVFNNVDYFINKCMMANAKLPYVTYVVTKKNKEELIQLEDYFRGRCVVLPARCDGRGGEDKEAAYDLSYSKDPCTYALDGAYVLSNLNVVPCCEDWAGIEIMGNLSENSLKEIIDGERYNKFRAAHLSGEKGAIGLCKNCKTNMIYNSSRYERE